MSDDKLREKMEKVANLAIGILEKRTGLNLSGLSTAERNRRVKEWEKSQKKGTK